VLRTSKRYCAAAVAAAHAQISQQAHNETRARGRASGVVTEGWGMTSSMEMNFTVTVEKIGLTAGSLRMVDESVNARAASSGARLAHPYRINKGRGGGQGRFLEKPPEPLLRYCPARGETLGRISYVN